MYLKMIFYMKNTNINASKREKQHNYLVIDDETPSVKGIREEFIPTSVKIQIWENSRTAKGFNPKDFRQDALGNVCIKDYHYTRSDDTRTRISYNYEIIISSSYDGLSNLCLLNAGIIEDKKFSSKFSLKNFEAKSLREKHAISFDDLEKKLSNDMHWTCKRYNIYFKKIGGVWSVMRRSYNNQHRSKKTTLMFKTSEKNNNTKKITKNQTDTLEFLVMCSLSVIGALSAAISYKNIYHWRKA